MTKRELLASEVVAAPPIWMFCDPWKKAEVEVVLLPKTTVFVSLFAPVRSTADWKYPAVLNASLPVPKGVSVPAMLF